nr:LysR family transcriptional regulator [Mesorhizobium sp. IRAMC:0171]
MDYVFAAVDHGSLRQAARMLGVRESSVSRNIVALEQYLNMQLFDRSAYGVRLTEAGQTWVGAARTHYEGLNEALVSGGRGRRDANTLRLGLSALAGRAFLARLIRRFGELHSKVDVIIEDISYEQGLSAIRRRQLDIVFTNGHVATSCAIEAFGRVRLFVLLPVRHPLARMSAVSLADLANERVFVPSISNQSTLGAPPVEQSRPAQICTASEATAILKVQLGQGVILAEEGFAKSVSADLTTWKPLRGKNSVSSITAVWLDSNPKRALLRFLGLARKLAVSGSRGDAWNIANKV